mmetsp:Transcript_22734/g.37406  ORF Transcript_22734/g.37406 Transcript_22734/m.37406 type:complete len:182 (+) Transcript_22734:918-1463(+)
MCPLVITATSTDKVLEESQAVRLFCVQKMCNLAKLEFKTVLNSRHIFFCGWLIYPVEYPFSKHSFLFQFCTLESLVHQRYFSSSFFNFFSPLFMGGRLWAHLTNAIFDKCTCFAFFFGLENEPPRSRRQSEPSWFHIYRENPVRPFGLQQRQQRSVCEHGGHPKFPSSSTTRCTTIQTQMQ